MGCAQEENEYNPKRTHRCQQRNDSTSSNFSHHTCSPPPLTKTRLGGFFGSLSDQSSKLKKETQLMTVFIMMNMWRGGRRGNRSRLCCRLYDDLVRYSLVVAEISDTSGMSLCPLGGLLLIPSLRLVLRILGSGFGIGIGMGRKMGGRGSWVGLGGSV